MCINKKGAGLLAGGYDLVTTYAHLTDAEQEETKEMDETPLVTLAVRRTWLAEFIKNDFGTVDEFLTEYTYDTAIGFEHEAAANKALAFKHRPALRQQFAFPSEMTGDAMLAFADYLSGMLAENGHADAAVFLNNVLNIKE